MTSTDHGRALEWLRRVGYYRLSGYFLPFRIPGTDDFRPGVTFDDVVSLYKFDCGLRLLTLQAMDRIEVAVRAVITYQLSHSLGVFGYADPRNFDPSYDHSGFMRIMRQEENRSAEVFVNHYRTKYTSEPFLPVWMATEIVSFGALSQMFANLRKSLRKLIAREFKQPESVFVSWLHALTSIRNACAHHARLWNKELAVKPELPNAWKVQGVSNRRYYAIALIMQTLLIEISPASQWKQRLKAHIDTYPDVDILHMHFPADWTARNPWT
ncbi:MAG TPA: Abi family protein [Terracidiphilus sp.]|nr:Abi family protein [Terracidiphilus sp.]